MGAPQVTIETITVTRPLKVIAFTCCAFTVILMIAATSTSDWMNTDGWREGLFSQCVGAKGLTPVPFADTMIELKEDDDTLTEEDKRPKPGCYKGRGASYIRGAAALVIIGLFTDFFGTVLTGLGLRSTDPNKKYKYYRVAIYALIVAAIALMLAAIIYPVQFSRDFHNEKELDGNSWDQTNDHDFDNDGIPNKIDPDDDNDGILDDEDTDDDNDGILDDVDPDDDNDGKLDTEEDDMDGDGVNDDEDIDNDNDGINDEDDPDDDNDGVMDDVDPDDDNDGLPDDEEIDTDGDGQSDAKDKDDDNDGIDDIVDTDDNNDGVIEASEAPPTDGDGVVGEVVEPVPHHEGNNRVYSFGFGYGATWGSIVLIFASVVLLICDRESEEIYYKEKQVEEDEEEEAGDA